MSTELETYLRLFYHRNAKYKTLFIYLYQSNKRNVTSRYYRQQWENSRT